MRWIPLILALAIGGLIAANTTSRLLPVVPVAIAFVFQLWQNARSDDESQALNDDKQHVHQ